MKNSSESLKHMLHNGNFFLNADLFTLTLLNGDIHRLTNRDRTIDWDSQRYIPATIKRGKISWITGMEVDTLSIQLFKPSMLAGAFTGSLDGASILLQKAFFTFSGAYPTNDFSSHSTPTGVLTIFSGRVSDVSGTATQLNITVKSDMELLNVNIPRNIYQPTCLNTLYEASCCALPAWFLGTVQAVHAGYVTAHMAGEFRDSWFDQGHFEWIDGLNAGSRRTVKKFGVDSTSNATTSLKTFHFIAPFIHAIQPNDSFRVCAGCDKTKATCQAKFNNLAHFRGFPFIPAPETPL